MSMSSSLIYASIQYFPKNEEETMIDKAELCASKSGELSKKTNKYQRKPKEKSSQPLFTFLPVSLSP